MVSLPNTLTSRINIQETKEIKNQVSDLSKKGWVQKILNSYVIPMLLVPKKDETWRMCTNYKVINNIIIKHRYLIPRLDDMLDDLHGTNMFFKN